MSVIGVLAEGTAGDSSFERGEVFGTSASVSEERRAGRAAGAFSGIVASSDVVVEVVGVESSKVVTGPTVSAVAVVGDIDLTVETGSFDESLENEALPFEVSSVGTVVAGVMRGISGSFVASAGRGVATRVILSSGVAVAVDMANRKSGEGALLISGDVVDGLLFVSSFSVPSFASPSDITPTASSATAGLSITFATKGTSDGVTITTTASPASLPLCPLLALEFDAVLCKSRLRA